VPVSAFYTFLMLSSRDCQMVKWIRVRLQYNTYPRNQETGSWVGDTADFSGARIWLCIAIVNGRN